MSGSRHAKGTGAGFVYDELRREILHLRLEPGATLDEISLVTRFGLSRTPVREALIRLAADGLVTMLPNRGAQVATLDLSDFPRFMEAFDLLQRAVTRLAALRRSAGDLATIIAARNAFEEALTEQEPLALTERNRDFHLAIAEAAHNAYLSGHYRRLLDEGMRLLRIPFAYDPVIGTSADAHIAKVVEEHRAMVQAITARDAAAAEAVGHAHCELFHRRITEYLKRNDLGELSVAEM